MRLRPVVLIEVKPTVGALLKVLDGQHLCQMFVQGFYAMTKNNLDSLIVGLTDSVTWHLFEIAPSEPPLLCVNWYAVTTTTAETVAFLATCLNRH